MQHTDRIVPITQISIGARFRNLDTHKVEELKKSIDRFGLFNPPLVDDNLNLVQGAHRLAALHQLGYEETRVTFAERLTETERRMMELEENVKRHDMTWKERAIAVAEIHKLERKEHSKRGESWCREQTGALLGITDVSVHYALIVAEALNKGDEEIAKCESLREALRVFLRRREDQKVKELAQRMYKKPEPSGDIAVSEPQEEDDNSATYNIDLSTLINADALTFLAKNQAVAHHIITDPPYAIEMSNLAQQNTGIDDIQRVEKEHDVMDNLQLLQDFIDLSYGALKDHGFLVMWCDHVHFEWLAKLGRDAGYNVQRWPLVWCKTSSCINQAAQYNFTKATEIAIVMRKAKAMLVEPQSANYFLGSRDPEARHPFWKPASLWQWVLKAVAVPGQTILDPFAGEGSLPVAAIDAGFKPLAVEVNETHYSYLVQNVKEKYKQKLGSVQFV